MDGVKRRYVVIMRVLLSVFMMFTAFAAIPVYAEDESTPEPEETVTPEETELPEETEESETSLPEEETPESTEEPEMMESPEPEEEELPEETVDAYDADTASYQGYSASGKGFVLYVRPQGSTETGEVAYCFDASKNLPTRAIVSTTLAYTKEDATASSLYGYVDKTKVNPKGTTAQQFYDNIMRVLYYGYPNNKNLPDSENLQKKYGIEDEEFRYATQRAIWYFTNGYSEKLNSTDISTMGGDGGVYTDLITHKGNVPSDFNLHIYMPNDSSYQALMSTDRDTSGQDVNAPKTYSLTVSKSVSGQGDKDEKFSFVIELKDAKGDPFTGEVTRTIKAPDESADTLTITDGKVNMDLMDGWSYTLTGLPEGYSYTVTETGAENYTTKINGTVDADKSVFETGVKADVTLAFDNSMELTPPEDPVSYDGKLDIEKEYAGPYGTYLPHQTFTFQIIPVDVTDGQMMNGLPVYDGIGDTVTETLTFTTDDKAEDQGTYTGTKQSTWIDFSYVYTFTKPGIYRYKVQEVKGNTKGIIYDTEVYNLAVYVTYDEENKLEAGYITSVNSQGVSGFPVFTNTLETGDLSFRKSVRGNLADKNEKFGFYVSVTDPEGRYSGPVPMEAIIYKDDGTVSQTTTIYIGKSTYIYLTDGQKMTIYDLPVGVKALIQEDEDTAKGYTVTLNDPSGNIVEDGKLEHTVSTDDNSFSYTFINSRETIVSTGVDENTKPYVILLVEVAAGILLLSAVRFCMRIK